MFSKHTQYQGKMTRARQSWLMEHSPIIITIKKYFVDPPNILTLHDLLYLSFTISNLSSFLFRTLPITKYFSGYQESSYTSKQRHAMSHLYWTHSNKTLQKKIVFKKFVLQYCKVLFYTNTNRKITVYNVYKDPC